MSSGFMSRHRSDAVEAPDAPTLEVLTAACDARFPAPAYLVRPHEAADTVWVSLEWMPADGRPTARYCCRAEP
jgi:hypothetical protein